MSARTLLLLVGLAWLAWRAGLLEGAAPTGGCDCDDRRGDEWPVYEV